MNFKKVPNPKNKLFIILGFSIYVVVMLLTGTTCPFNRFLGIVCPGCGMTRALICALQFKFADAFDYHMMFWSIPLLFLYFIFEGKLFRNKWADRVILIILSVGFLINWITSIIYGIG